MKEIVKRIRDEFNGVVFLDDLRKMIAEDMDITDVHVSKRTIQSMCAIGLIKPSADSHAFEITAYGRKVTE